MTVTHTCTHSNEKNKILIESLLRNLQLLKKKYVLTEIQQINV